MPTFGLRERKINTLHAFWPRVAEVGLVQIVKGIRDKMPGDFVAALEDPESSIAVAISAAMTGHTDKAVAEALHAFAEKQATDAAGFAHGAPVDLVSIAKAAAEGRTGPIVIDEGTGMQREIPANS